MYEAFQLIPFSDRNAAEGHLSAVLSGDQPGLAKRLAEVLAVVSDPFTTLVRLERFLASADRAGVCRRFAESARYARMLATLLNESHFLTDLLCSNPRHMEWLIDGTDLGAAWPRDDLISALREAVSGAEDFDAVCREIRRFKQRAILRISARDVFVAASVASVTEDLSNLAEGALEVAIEAATPELEERFGVPLNADGSRAQFTVLGMGKLGGKELNFSSDIDLLFVYSEDGDSETGSSNAEYFNRLGERIVKALSEQMAEGHVFRVDMRLRPHGRMGPLAVSLDSCLTYYESYGQAWERQALIKARPVAGDLELGSTFIDRTRPFAFPRYFDDATLEDIREVKRQMEASVHQRGHTELGVKLGRGGIRDIEFTVQMLQLLNGGRVAELRTRNTLEAIEALGRIGSLRPLEASTLASNYSFLRRVEHRLQIEGSQQRHVLPEDPAALEAFAKRLGYRDAKAFMSKYRERTAENRRILEQFLATEGSGKLWVKDLLNPRSDAEESLQQLGDLGFSHPGRAREELLLLAVGKPQEPHAAHVRQQFARVAPDLLDALVTCSDPDAALRRLGQMLAGLRAPSAIYDILHWNPHLCEYLARLIANSEYLTQIIIRDPGLFETLRAARILDDAADKDRLREHLGLLQTAYDPGAAPYRLRDGEMLRIGARELFLDLDVLDVGRELSDLADVILQDALAKARVKTVDRYGEASAGFAVLGLGKHGGRELGYGSDLDLIFVYESGGGLPDGMSPDQYFADVGTRTINLLQERTRYGMLYEIDARLRPYGKKGQLVVSSELLERYYAKEAEAWERLALVKARGVAGDPEFAKAMEAKARELAFGTPLTAADIERVEELRGRIAAQASPLDLKKQEGGVAEIEFGLRLLQIQHAQAYPELRRGDVRGAVEALVTRSLLSEEDGAALVAAYLLLRRIENRIRMMHGRSGTNLPDDPLEQQDLANRLGLDGDLAAIVEAQRASVHDVYQRILRRV
jgi:[glutamine synthetase] adenylyltransferase / [glutamine synthetase]-adenylyl-L-tyrosine phosphorylase